MTRTLSPWTWAGVTQTATGRGYYHVKERDTEKTVCMVSDQPPSVARMIACIPKLLAAAEAALDLLTQLQADDEETRFDPPWLEIQDLEAAISQTKEESA